MANTLVSPADLLDFPGAPFNDYLVDIAAASVRGDARWHIAPVVTETLTVASYGGQVLALPTRRVVAVTAVRDVSTVGSPVVVTGFIPLVGSLFRGRGWPIGSVEVDLSHGYVVTPLELLPVVAARVASAANPHDPSVSQRSTTRGPFTDSETYRFGVATAGVDPVVARYAVLPGVA